MPVSILIKVADNVVPPQAIPWESRQIVTATQQAEAFAQHFFTYVEMPVRLDTNPITVEALNNRDQNSYKKFTGFRLLNSGLIDVGLNNLEVVEDDIVVRQNDGIFVRYTDFPTVGTRTATDQNFFYHIDVTDRDLEQVAQYIQPVFDDSDPPVLISQSKYRISQAGFDLLVLNDGWLEGPWSDFEDLFVDEHP